MTRGPSRRIALSMLLGFLLQLSGVLDILAANGSVRGRLAVEGGSPPQGTVVRATPLDGGPASTAALGADSSYQFPQLKEGAYLFEVIGPDGHLLGPGTKTLVPPGVLQLNLRVKIQPTSPVQPQEAVPPKSEPVAPTTPAPGTTAERPPQPVRRTVSPSKKKWTVLAVIVGSLGVGLAVGNNGNDHGVSPSQP